MYRIIALVLFITCTSLGFCQKKKADQYYQKGNQKLEDLDYSGAIADYTEAITAKSNFPEAYYKRGIAKTYLYDKNGALADFDEAIKQKHNYDEAYFERGFQKLALKRYLEAIEDFSKVIEIKPTDKTAFYNRGLAKYYLQDYAGSISDNSRAIDLDSKYLNAFYNRSLARYEMKDYQGTILDNTKIIELDSNYGEAYYNLGLSYYYLGDYNKSINAYGKVIEKIPTYVNAYYSRGLSKHYNKDYQGAIEDFSKTLELKPSYEQAYYGRGLAKYYLNDLRGSMQDYEKALALNPNYSQAKTELAFVTEELTRTASRSMEEAENVNVDLNVKLPQVWAVIVGVSQYKDGKMNLKFADKDAYEFYNFLKSPQGGGLSEDHISLLTNEKATRGNIIKALNEKFYRAFEEDMVILFIASHGAPDPVGNEVYFLSYDTESDNLGGTAVSQIDIEKVFQRTRAKKKIWVADACHSGGAGLQIRGTDQSLETNKLLHEIANANNGMAMFTASSSSEYSHEDKKWGNGHGVFTYYLLEGMKGQADFNKNGLVDIRELYEYVYRKVSDDTNGQQHPELKGSFDNKLPVSIHK